MVMLILLASLVLEQCMFSRFLWRWRFVVVVVLTFVIPAATAPLVIDNVNWLGVVLALTSLMRLANLFRIAQARMHQAYLRRTTQRTSGIVALLQLVVMGLLASIWPLEWHITNAPLWMAALQAVVAAGLLLITTRNMYKTRYRQGTTFYADKELPTVSLLIPARNETQDLEECLRSAIASDYPKLEIIVLDDCSQAKTSDIIKSYAHDGVRFVKGKEPSENWLAKNQAYEKLAEEASGELLLFCGVDVRFGPHAIKALVTELLNRDKQMISVLPHRLAGSLAGAFIQPMRYWWELALPRNLVNRPPVLSTCWLITSKSFKKLGSFKAVSHSIIPEGFFARELIRTNSYSFIRSNSTLDVQTAKSYTEQRATAVRLRYPQLRRRPENVFVLAVTSLVFLLGPFIGLVFALINGWHAAAVLSAVAAGLLVTIHVLIVYNTSPANVLVALVNFPVEVVTEIVIAFVSMLRYEYGTVEWKDRNICIPVMHVVPKLPNLPEN